MIPALTRFWMCLIFIVSSSILWISIERLLAPNLSLSVGLLICLGFGLVFWIISSPMFFKSYVKEATPESLAWIRIITCTTLLIMTLWIEDIPSTTLLPEEVKQFHTIGLFQFLYFIPGFNDFLNSANSLQIFQGLTAIILFLGIIGWRTRIVIPLGTLFWFILGAIPRHYTYFFHTGLVPLYLMTVLSFTPCGDGLSIDQLKADQNNKISPKKDSSLVYGWSRYACWVVIALSYVMAGMSKIRDGGFDWWTPINLKGYIYSGTLSPGLYDWGWSLYLTHAPDILFALMGIVGIYGEIAYGLVLFSSKARFFFPLLMMNMHLGIFFLQHILFLDMILLQLIFFDITQTNKVYNLNFNWILNKVKRNKTIHLIENSKSLKKDRKLLYPFLVSTVAIILFFSWFYKVESYPLSAMKMFSGRRNSPIVGYYKLIGYNTLGETITIYPERIIPALGDVRSKNLIRVC
jgi:type IV secretory pathway TrbD component